MTPHILTGDPGTLASTGQRLAEIAHDIVEGARHLADSGKWFALCPSPFVGFLGIKTTYTVPNIQGEATKRKVVNTERPYLSTHLIGLSQITAMDSNLVAKLQTDLMYRLRLKLGGLIVHKGSCRIDENTVIAVATTSFEPWENCAVATLAQLCFPDFQEPDVQVSFSQEPTLPFATGIQQFDKTVDRARYRARLHTMQCA
jgi:hypothetical protein